MGFKKVIKINEKLIQSRLTNSKKKARPLTNSIFPMLIGTLAN